MRGPGPGHDREAQSLADDAVLVNDLDEDVVVGRPTAAVMDLATDLSRRPEQHQRLVDEVRAEVEQHSPARSGGVVEAPRALGLSGASARSATRSACTSPSSPASIRRRRVRKSESQRRLWKTVRGTPADAASLDDALRLRRRSAPAACRPRRPARARARAWRAARESRSESRPPRSTARRHAPRPRRPSPRRERPGYVATRRLRPLGVRRSRSCRRASPGVEATSGAWKTEPASPYPISAPRFSSMSGAGDGSRRRSSRREAGRRR